MIKQILKPAPMKLNDLQQRSLDSFIESIAMGQLLTEEVAECPCGGTVLEQLADHDRFGLDFKTLICQKCGLLLTNPRITESSLARYYEDFYHPMNFGKAESRVKLHQFRLDQGFRIFEFVKKSITKRDIRIAELGCGSGANLAQFRHAALKEGIRVECTGAEFDPLYVKAGKDRGFDIREGGIETFANDKPYDLLILSHVFEHMVELKSGLDSFGNILGGLGLLYLEVPGVRSLDHKYEYGCELSRYLTHSHIYNFTRRSLEHIVSSVGWRPLVSNEEVQALFVKDLESELITGDDPANLKAYLEDLASNLSRYRSMDPASTILGRLRRVLWKFKNHLRNRAIGW
jgi:hypothetical protein